MPADVVIPRLPWVPIYADRLWDSNFFAVATAEEFKAAFCLWVKSWTQRPPGSLPNDDRLLCRLAELNGNLAKWGKVKRMALRHWVLCDDDRLYHPVVAELVLDAYQRLSRNQSKARHAATTRWNSKKGKMPQAMPEASQHKHKQEKPPNPRNGGGKEVFKNGGSGAAEPPAINPKLKGHSLPCDCPNCTRWAAQQRSAE